MKTCPNCEKDDVPFAKHSKRKDGLQIYCKPCMKVLNAVHYKNGYKIIQNEINRNKRAELKSIINKYKASKGCPCGESEACCLDFHHVGKKEDQISRMISEQASWERIEAEIKKCIVICSNCHRKIHAKKYPSWFTGVWCNWQHDRLQSG